MTLGDLLDRPPKPVEDVQVYGLFPDDLEDLLLMLRDREQDVLRRRFGMTPYDEVHTLEEIGQVYGVTRERIRQVETKALKLMRAELVSRGWDVRTDENDSLKASATEPRQEDQASGLASA